MGELEIRVMPWLWSPELWEKLETSLFLFCMNEIVSYLLYLASNLTLDQHKSL